MTWVLLVFAPLDHIYDTGPGRATALRVAGFPQETTLGWALTVMLGAGFTIMTFCTWAVQLKLLLPVTWYNVVTEGHTVTSDPEGGVDEGMVLQV